MAPYILVDADNVIQDVTIDAKYSKVEIPDEYFVKFNVENDDI